jgi:hypothetical protein
MRRVRVDGGYANKRNTGGLARDISVPVPARYGLFDVGESQHRNPTNCSTINEKPGMRQIRNMKMMEKKIGSSLLGHIEMQKQRHARAPLKTRMSAAFRMPEEIVGMTWLRANRKPGGKR